SAMISPREITQFDPSIFDMSSHLQVFDGGKIGSSLDHAGANLEVGGIGGRLECARDSSEQDQRTLSSSDWSLGCAGVRIRSDCSGNGSVVEIAGKSREQSLGRRCRRLNRQRKGACRRETRSTDAY